MGGLIAKSDLLQTTFTWTDFWRSNIYQFISDLISFLWFVQTGDTVVNSLWVIVKKNCCLQGDKMQKKHDIYDIIKAST